MTETNHEKPLTQEEEDEAISEAELKEEDETPILEPSKSKTPESTISKSLIEETRKKDREIRELPIFSEAQQKMIKELEDLIAQEEERIAILKAQLEKIYSKAQVKKENSAN